MPYPRSSETAPTVPTSALASAPTAGPVALSPAIGGPPGPAAGPVTCPGGDVHPRLPGRPAATGTARPAPRWLALGLAALLTALFVLGAHPAGAAGAGWAWPVSPRPGVERAFEAPAQKWLPGHRGVDLSAPPGTPLRSPAAGVVSFSGVVVDREVLTIDHGDGRKSSVEPVSATVRRGERVERGQVVARVAAPGHGPRGGSVHWGVREHGEYVNPLQFVVDLRPSVLLPVPDAERSAPGAS
ncbi:murein DD-endopeptidase MepM/ murein hydrolase activator NlpD [Kocuria rhizophila]|uniref:M23 family metallopeptidase n=1 Tax=Kocuria rhizophila TaxID=72000 RepID=UPI0028546217|nr:M23 family metallopeptidase [Kocuria rhizophila]MDR7375034.1 murein DD-endopeptidase MepM/ murein hydrolase activator NlpD [Kocuria rhizophila]